MKRKILKKFNAFSLAEIMIALVIVAILMAASAPLVNRRTNLDNNFQCLWSNASKGIFFNNKGTGQVGIGVEPSNSLPLHLYTKQSNLQIAFYDENTDSKTGVSLNNIIGLSNNNIYLGANYKLGGSGNLVIGHASEKFPAEGHKLAIGSRSTSYEPILYGDFNSILGSQILKVNGKLQVGAETSLDTTSNYDLIVGNRGVVIAPGSATNPADVVIKDSTIKISRSGETATTTMKATGLTVETTNYTTNIGQGISTNKILVDANTNGLASLGEGNIKASGIIKSETEVQSSIDILANNDIIGQHAVKSNGYIEAAGVIKANGGIEATSGVIATYSDISIYNDNRSAVTISLLNNSGAINSEGSITTNKSIDAQSLGKNLKSVISSMIPNSASDEKLKNDIIDTDLGLDIIRKINIKQYKFNNPQKYGDGIRYGVIAQDLQKILPNVVNKNDDGFLTIRPNDIFFIALNAIKELDKELQYIKHLLNIDELKLDCSKLSAFKIVAKLNKLNDENIELKNEIKLLKEQNNSLEKRLKLIEKQLKLD